MQFYPTYSNYFNLNLRALVFYISLNDSIGTDLNNI